MNDVGEGIEEGVMRGGRPVGMRQKGCGCEVSIVSVIL